MLFNARPVSGHDDANFRAVGAACATLALFVGSLLLACACAGDAAAATACGGNGQRACCFASTERDNAGGACAGSAVEVPGCGSATGQSDCTCGGSGLAVFFGSSSSSHCQVPVACGQAGQRACCITETRYPNNPIPLSAGCFGTSNGGLNNLTEVAGGVPKPAVCGGDNPFGLLSNGHCVACGTEGAHACVGDSVSAGQRCNPGLVEDAFGFCASCGGDGQLVCRSTGAEDWMCNRGFHPSFGVCVKDRVIAEPDCDCQPLPPSGNPALPVRGYADLHLHMFANLGFGGLTVWGDAFDPKGGVSQALRADNYAQRTADYVLNGHVKQGIHGDVVPIDAFRRQQLVHGDNHINDIVGFGTGQQAGLLPGAPTLDNGGVQWDTTFLDDFAGWPRWNSTTHQQAYYTWLQRAHRGGLQLAVLLAVTNESMCIAGRYLDYPEFDCAKSKGSIDLQLAKAYELERWLMDECAGAQFALSGNNPLFPGTPAGIAAQKTVARACATPSSSEGWFKVVTSPQQARAAIAKGQLAVVLGIEEANLFGCNEGICTAPYVAAQLDEYYAKGVRHVFPIHNFDNDYGGSASWMDTIAVGNRYATGEWYETENCPATKGEAGGGDGYGFKIAPGFSDWLAAVIFGLPVVLDLPAYYDGLATSCNKHALTPLGTALVTSMMRKGMIVDIDHMSIKGVDATLALAMQYGYPGIVASHALMFDLTKQEHRHERMRTAEQLRRIAALGGMIGAMTQPAEAGGRDNPATLLPPPGTKVNNDCEGSSKTWAQSYEWAVKQMTVGGVKRPVAFGTDFNGISRHNAPRFGFDSCGFSPGVDVPQDATRVTYPFTIAGFGTFDKQKTGDAVFDYNTAGLAHVGLLPDMIADLKKVGLSDQDLEPLFQSAEAYLQMWETSLLAATKVPPPPDTDAIAPTVSAQLSATPNAAAWFNVASVTATITATDNPGGSGVAEIGYRFTSDNFYRREASAQVVVAFEEGIGTLLFFARDINGNVSGVASTQARVDLTKPSIAGTIGATPNAAGWHRADVPVTFSCSDALSGLASCGPNALLTGEGAGLSVGGTAVDRAGNSSTASVGGINIDRTPPSVQITLPLAKSYPTSATLRIDWTATDALSGIAAESALLDGVLLLAKGQLVQPPKGAHTLKVTVVDKAGNVRESVVDFAVTDDPASPPQNGWWWNPAESGRGFFIEVKGGVLFMAGYFYANDGRAAWAVSGGPMTNANNYRGDLVTVRNGQTLVGPYREPAPTDIASAGPITLNFADDSHGILAWAGGIVAIERQIFGSGSAAFQPTGWWWNPAQNGRGFSIEVQGDTMDLVAFMYDADGIPVWYISTGKMTTPMRYSGRLEQIAGGQTMTGPYRPPTGAKTVGSIRIDFDSLKSATLTLADIDLYDPLVVSMPIYPQLPAP
jgi:microsomal dipeptidase-like Zn-dependent dipeptidase